MQFDDYQRAAGTTAHYDQDDLTYKLMYICLGLAGESGEVIEKIKKIIRNDHAMVSDEKREDLKREMGDVLWYLSQLARELNISFDDVAETNIKKLADRAARSVIKSEGDNR